MKFDIYKYMGDKIKDKKPHSVFLSESLVRNVKKEIKVSLSYLLNDLLKEFHSKLKNKSGDKK